MGYNLAMKKELGTFFEENSLPKPEEVEELVGFLDAQARRLEKELDRELPLPKYLFHATTRESNDQIRNKKLGLQPSQLLRSGCKTQEKKIDK